MPQGVLLPQPFAPVARFTMSPTSPGEEQDVIFDGSSSTASCVPDPANPNDATKCSPTSGAITSYQWDFGNGQTGSGPRVTTRFSTRGAYNVRLVVTNDRGLSNSVTQTVTVAGVANPTAAFDAVAGGAGRQPAGVLRRQRVAGRTWPHDHPLRLELRRRRRSAAASPSRTASRAPAPSRSR